MATSGVFVCTICNSFASRSYGPVLRHIGVTHRFGPRCNITCGIDGCPATYHSDKYESFRSHVYRKHRDVLSSQDDPSNQMDTEEHNSDSTSELNPLVENDDRVDTTVPMKKVAALFLLKTLEERKVTQSALAGIISDADSLWNIGLDNIEKALSEKMDVNVDLRSILDQPLIHPFQGLHSDHMQEKYFKETFNLIEPVKRILARNDEIRDGHLVKTCDYCYDVPFLRSLQELLNTESVKESVFNSHSLNGELMGDFCDGELYACHSLFSEDPCALQIQLYYDEVEMANPIGSRKGVHKLGFFYYTLGNLPPRLRSTLKSIHLVNVCRYTDIEKHGIDVMLEPFIEDIQELEKVNKDEGVYFNINGDLVSFRGTLTLVSADNLSSQAIGGYKALNSAFRKCRTCMAVDDTMQTKFLECDFQLRTREIHASHCADLGGPLHAHIATTYGLARNSILNSSRYFHIVDGLVPDIMHDLLEGVLQLYVKLLLNYIIIREGRISLDDFNARVLSFHYGAADIRNRPTLISRSVLLSSDNKLSQSASQMWCLARALPFLVGDKVSQGDKQWDNYLQLLNIVDYTFAPVLTKSKVAYLAVMIEDFLTDFKDIYGRRLIPKMHYMVHFPTWIKRCGPLVHVWCMRYESKHSHFKHLARVIGNFKNVLLTLAVRHQRYMCLQMLDTELYLKHTVTTGKFVTCRVSALCESVQLLAVASELDTDSIVYKVSSVQIMGTTYRKNDIVIHSYQNDEPQFGRIVHFITTAVHNTYFVLRILQTVSFSEHFHAYEVSPSRFRTDVCVQTDLVDYHPLIECKTFDPTMCDRTFVRLKYHVF